MIIIRCARCKAKVLRYEKIGQGKVLKCHLARISRNYGLLNDKTLSCPKCNNILGENQGSHIKMHQAEFTFGGRIV